MLIPHPNFNTIGHRGVASLRPENTLLGFNYAREQGLNWIEFDTRLTKDDTWIIMHDAKLDRTTNGKGYIKDLTYAELKKYQAGLWYTPPYAGEKIPTLQETMELAWNIGLQVNIEVKGAKEEGLDRYVDKFTAFLNKIPKNMPRPLISSFDTEFIIAIRKKFPEIPIGYLIDEFNNNTIDIALKNNFTTINCWVKNIKLEDIKLAEQHKLPVLLFTVNDPKIAAYWIENGVTAVFSDKSNILIV